MNGLLDRSKHLSPRAGLGLLLISFAGLGALLVANGTGSILCDVACLLVIAALTLLGWNAALSLSGDKVTPGGCLVMLALLLILHMACDGLSIVIRVAGFGFASDLAMALCLVFFLGAWHMAFYLFRRVVEMVPGRFWQIPCAALLMVTAIVAALTVATFDPYPLTAIFTPVVFATYLMWRQLVGR